MFRHRFRATEGLQAWGKYFADFRAYNTSNHSHAFNVPKFKQCGGNTVKRSPRSSWTGKIIVQSNATENLGQILCCFRETRINAKRARTFSELIYKTTARNEYHKVKIF